MAVVSYPKSVLEADVLRLITTPVNVPIYAVRWSKRHRRQVMRIDYVTDPHAARYFLPEPLKLPELARASIQVTEYFDLFEDGPTVEIAQTIEAISPAGVKGDYVVAAYTDSLPSLMVNRELYLQPTMPGLASVTHRQGVSSFRLAIQNETVVTGTAGYKYECASADEAHALFGRPKFFLKVLGTPFLGESAKPTLFSLRPAELEIAEAHTSPVKMNFSGHVLAPVDDLPIQHLQSYHQVDCHWTPDFAEVIHTYG